MANEIIKNGIIGSLESLVEMAANVTATEGLIHQLDIDLLMDQIRKLYRDVQMLDEANRKELNSGMQLKAMPHVEHAEKPVFEEAVKINLIVKEDKPLAETQEMNSEPVAEPVPEPLPIATITLPEPEPTPEPVVNHTPAHEISNGNDLFSQPLTVADKLKKEDNSIHQQMMTNNSFRNEMLTGAPIQNLRSAIGINDKFMFVNELFRGGMKDYETAIEHMNNAGNLDDAMRILHQNLELFETTTKTDAKTKLEFFVTRRFMK